MTVYEDEVREPEAADAFHAAALMGFGTLIFIGAACEGPGVFSVAFSVLAVFSGVVTSLALRSGRRLQRTALGPVEAGELISVEA